MNSVIPHSFLFRYSVRIPRFAEATRHGKVLELPDACRVPALGELDGSSSFADVRVAWNERELIFRASVRRKQDPPACDSAADRAEESDGLHVWIDMRPAGTIHRATRFCHQFCFLPTGSGRKRDQPSGIQLPIPQAREDAAINRPEELQVSAEVLADGYELQAILKAEQLTGFDIEASRQLGFYYVVRDSEHGEQFLAMNREFPIAHDPSMWITLDLED